MAVQAAIVTDTTGTRLTGQMSVPSQFQTGIGDAIVAEAERVSAELDAMYDDYQQSTSDYQFELSLRGMRTLIPAFCDSMQSVLNSIQRSAHRQIDQRWPWYAPGKSSAKSSVTSQINALRTRFSTLKTRVLTGDDATVRAALASAINSVLSNQVVRVSVSVLGTLYGRDVVDGTQESRLRTALSAIAALPSTSGRMVQTKTLWEQAPKRDSLMAAANDIAAGVAGAVPQITAIGFDQPFGQPSLTLFVVVQHQEQSSTVSVEFDPVRPEEIGIAVGRLVAVGL